MRKWWHQPKVDTSTDQVGYRRIHHGVSTAIRGRWAKTIVAALCFVPAAIFTWEVSGSNFNSHVGEIITRQTGDWTIIFLILTLAITPIRRFLNLPDLIRFRRMFGLFTFMYGCLHLGAWRAFKMGHMLQFRTITIWSLRIGFLGFVLMIPLAITSTDCWVRWLGGKRWRTLHTLAYLSAVAGIVHYCLLPDIGIWKPAVFSLFVALLLLSRIGPITRRVSPAEATKHDNV